MKRLILTVPLSLSILSASAAGVAAPDSVSVRKASAPLPCTASELAAAAGDTISTAELRKNPTSSLAYAMQGLAAGLGVRLQSGRPGAEALISVRGARSFNSAGVLYVVDGVVTDDISFLAPGDIASATLLKDAASTALYGSRGANGVIVVTTLSGRNRPARIAFDGFAGVQQLSSQADTVTYHDSKSIIDDADWRESTLREAWVQNYHLSVGGASERFTYLAAGSWFKQDGIVRGSGYNRLTSRLNASYRVAPWLLVGENIGFATDRQRRMADIVTRRDLEQRDYARSGTERWTGNVFADIMPLRGLILRSAYNFDYRLLLDDRMQRVYNYAVDNTLTYNIVLDANSLSATAGVVYEQFFGFTASKFSGLSWLGRLHYGYDGRYLADLTLRADRSDKYGKSARAVFPGAAVAWNMKREAFLEDYSSLTQLRLRLGWGRTGNDLPGRYDLPMHPDCVPWEKTSQFNAGADAGFWNDRLTVSVDVFDRDSRDVLLPVLPSTPDGSLLWTRAGRLTARGAEMRMDWNENIDDVTLAVSGNLTLLRTRLDAPAAERPARALPTTANGALPKWYYGLNMTMYWNSFDMQAFMQGAGGNKLYNQQHGAVEPVKYHRLKTFQIGWTIPRQWSDRIGLRQCRIYCQGSNLFTLSKYTGLYPEVDSDIDFGYYPPTRVCLVGLNFSY